MTRVTNTISGMFPVIYTHQQLLRVDAVEIIKDVALGELVEFLREDTYTKLVYQMGVLTSEYLVEDVL